MAAHAGALAPPLLRLPPRPLLRPRFPNPSPTLSCPRPYGPRLAVARAASGDDGGPPAEGDEKEKQGIPPPSTAEGDEKEPRGRPSFPALSEIRWRDILSPEPANATAVVLTGAIAWAGGSLLLQLSLIFLSIFAAAIKYSFIAAILLYLLIALL